MQSDVFRPAALLAALVDAHLSTSLQASLGAGYTLVGELSGGSMSRVFIAEEHALGRRVVVKVLPHYLANEVSLERFRREIQLAAQLQHPLIVPVLAAGESDGMRYYTMPFIAGESLRAALARRGRLDVGEVLTILQDVASALAYAHRRGVVHRDIKPDNILLSEDHALVTDFGVAKALESASVRHFQVTSDGEAVGTAAYMAPEQVTGDAHIDHRVDIYALGCVAYELLVGRPPFTGQSLHGILTAHLADDAEPPVTIRPEVGEELSDLVLGCLAKKPEDRWQGADQLLEALESFGLGSRRSLARVTGTGDPMEGAAARVPTSWGKHHSGGGSSGGRARSGVGPAMTTATRERLTLRRTRRLVAGGVAALVLAVGGVALARRLTTDADPAAVAGTVAVLPFRVAGADSSLGYLREGMVDLLTAKLTEASAPRALDPRAVLNAVRESAGNAGAELSEQDALALARRLGAKRLVLGSIVGTTTNIVITATLREMPSGDVSSASQSGPPDSLLVMVDRLAAQLLALDARLDRTRLADATSRSLPALKEYLAGQSAYRTGSFTEARAHYGKALEIDSTFALAALGMAASGAYGQVSEAARHAAGVDLAWRLRGRLSPRDQALFDAYVPVRYPQERSAAVELAAWKRAATTAPELPELWYGYADRLFHTGTWLGIDHAWERAVPSFSRAVEQDSTFIAPVSHLLEIAINAGDTAQVRRLAALYFPRDSAADEADGVRWRVGVALGDRRLLDRVHAEMGTFSVPTLARIMAIGQIEGVAFDDVQRAATTMRGLPLPITGRLAPALALHNLALNSGQPRAALDAVMPLLESPDVPQRVQGSFYHLGQLVVLDAMYGAGDSAAAETEVRELVAHLGDADVASHEARATQYADACTAELWRVRHGELSTVDRTLARLRAGSSPRDSVGYYGGSPDLCAAVLEGELALVRDTSSLRARAERLDSLMLQGPGRFGADFGNIVAARMFSRAGLPARARAALDRRPYYAFTGSLWLAEVLAERGRLALQLGDRPSAIRAWRHYLALRARAEPDRQAQVEAIRRQLAELERR